MKRTIDQVEVGDDCTCGGRPAVVLHVSRISLDDHYVVISYMDSYHDDEWHVPVEALDFDWTPRRLAKKPTIW